ncbi:MAG: hypothetical protein ACTS27_13015 [Phycisphaerales bacterium]
MKRWFSIPFFLVLLGCSKEINESPPDTLTQKLYQCINGQAFENGWLISAGSELSTIDFMIIQPFNSDSLQIQYHQFLFANENFINTTGVFSERCDIINDITVIKHQVAFTKSLCTTYKPKDEFANHLKEVKQKEVEPCKAFDPFVISLVEIKNGKPMTTSMCLGQKHPLEGVYNNLKKRSCLHFSTVK